MEKKKMPKTPSQLHAGHRSRVRQRFLTGGLGGFQDHEVLEFLLFYAVPRRDVNEMAHMLLDRFGSLTGVLDAPEEELCTIPGVGPGIAHFLNLIPEVMVQMARKSYEKAPVLRGPKSLARILSQNCPELPLGHLLLILTDAAQSVLAIYPYDSFERITAREVATKASRSQATSFALVERVADSSAIPGEDRLRAIRELAAQMEVLETPMRDYYTVDDLGHPPRSFARSGQLLPW